MADDEAVALYGMVKRMAQAMTEREASLSAKTDALEAVVANLQQLPVTLGKQTSQYIAAGVKASIQDDFSLPIGQAIKGPMAELERATYHARIVMEQVGKEVRYQSWIWAVALVLFGFALGGAAGYFFFVRDLSSINDRIDAIQQKIATPAPPEKSGDGVPLVRKTHPRFAKEAAPKEPAPTQPSQP